MQKNDIKLALQLMKPELKISWFSFIGLFLYFSLFTVLFYTGFSAQNERFVGLDLFFLLLFIFGPIWFRPKGLQYQKINSNTWASPAVLVARTLPIKKSVIVIKSIMQYILFSFPYQLYMFVTLYLISPEVRGMMDLGEYVAFSIIWLSFGIYAGYSALPVDVGSTTQAKMVTSVLSILLIVGIILLIFFFPYFFTYGVVEWSIIIAKKWPLLSSTISIIAAWLGFFYWKNKTINQFKKVDSL